MTAAVLAALALAAAAQPPTFEVRVEAVYVDVFVTQDGAPVTGLLAANFELRDDGQRRDVELVAVESMPVSTMLVLDTSGSVAGDKLGRLREGVRAVLSTVRPQDEVGLLTFSEELSLRVPAGPDATRVARALDGVGARGATALFDALYAGLALASERGRSLLVLFTDGEDNLSWLDRADAARALEVSNVLLQVVGMAGPTGREPEIDSRSGLLLGFRSSKDEPPHVATLRRLAESTGGRFWAAGSPGGIATAFRAMVEAMKTRYVLRFDPGRERRPGRHEIEVKLRGRRGKVHCRNAYFAAPSDR